MLSVLKKIHNAITAVLLVVAVLAAILLVGVRIFGLEPYVVLSGSMEPKYHVGSVIYVTKVDPKELEVGDPLTFRKGGAVVTHEIVEVGDNANPQNMYFVTQGLTNNVSDGRIPVSDIIGKPVFSIPYLGYVSTFLQQPMGIVCCICVLALFLGISAVFDRIPDKPGVVSTSDTQTDLSGPPNDPDGQTDEDKEKQDNNTEG